MELQIIEVKGKRVLTTEQIAALYGTDRKTISCNFSYNKKKYMLGKHYLKLEGTDLRAFKASQEIPEQLKYARIMYLWTEKGALLHAKSLNTDKAWEVYEYLVDFYFRAKEEKQETTQRQQAAEKPRKMFVDIPDNAEAQKLISGMRKYLTGMDALLDTYSMYHTEEQFKEISHTVDALAGRIIWAAMELKNFKPKLVEK